MTYRLFLRFIVSGSQCKNVSDDHHKVSAPASYRALQNMYIFTPLVVTSQPQTLAQKVVCDSEVQGKLYMVLNLKKAPVLVSCSQVY